MPYDFIVYQGASTELSQAAIKQYKFGAAVVLHLAERIPRQHHWHTLFFDNFFTSYGLLEVLRERNIGAIGTMQCSRFVNPPFRDDKDMKREGRGTIDVVMSKDKKVILTK